jgi:hypothetical protein
MKAPMFVLSLFALFSGYLFSDLFLGYGAMYFFDIVPSKNFYFLIEYESQSRKLVPFFLVIFAGFAAFCGLFYYRELLTLFLQRYSWVYFLSRAQIFFSKK